MGGEEAVGMFSSVTNALLNKPQRKTALVVAACITCLLMVVLVLQLILQSILHILQSEAAVENLDKALGSLSDLVSPPNCSSAEYHYD